MYAENISSYSVQWKLENHKQIEEILDSGRGKLSKPDIRGLRINKVENHKKTLQIKENSDFGLRS